MPSSKFSGAQIRQQFIDFFTARGHTIVPSASLVPGNDQTLLFTNSGMVQFKDVFLGIDKKPYTRAVDSQKCMRVAGKHNDLEDVGRDHTHHTFFEMLGNWSFGDYYKKEAITWAWELLTEVWKLPKESLYTTCFEDDEGNIERDDEAAQNWLLQPGMIPNHVLFFGRKDNLWEMAETGPCGPCSEIHLDRGINYCNKQDLPGHVCQVNGDCTRFTELWNLVFIQYNRTGPTTFEPLPARHVDTGMGFERIVSVLQGVDSNYRTDLLWPLILLTQTLTGHTDEERESNLTAYRVIADHARSAAFLIADGVIPGNTGRNYVVRMIIRRAARFGTKVGLHEAFLAKIAEKVIKIYGDFYPELVRYRESILKSITREENNFRRTLDSGQVVLNELLASLPSGSTDLSGEKVFDLYTTYGLPFEITRDIAREQGFDVDEGGFHLAMDEHRLASGGGEAFGRMGGEDANFYRNLREQLEEEGKLPYEGVENDPYQWFSTGGEILALVKNGQNVESAKPGEQVEVVMQESAFYAESGGQVSDIGNIVSADASSWEISITDVRKPAYGLVVHVGTVKFGEPKVGDEAVASIDITRRQAIRRNHTATHLLHAALHEVLGKDARQAGSLVAPDRLRFDFTHLEAITPTQLEEVEATVNQWILGDVDVQITHQSQQGAIQAGAMALFGEKYGETVRTVRIGRGIRPLSFELCGGTHVKRTSEIGLFLITSEGSAAAGIRRIEAVTGENAYEMVQRRFRALSQTAKLLSTIPEDVPAKTTALLDSLNETRKEYTVIKEELVKNEFLQRLENVPSVFGIPLLTVTFHDADADILRQMTDLFRQRYPSGIIVLASVNADGKPVIITAVSDDLVKRGFHAGDLVKFIAQPLGGGGGGRPNLAQAGGRDSTKLGEALSSVTSWVKSKLR